MTSPAPTQESFSLSLLASSRRFFRWLTTARVVLSLLMLAVMFVMVVVPLYRLVATTATWGPTDIPRHPEAVVGNFTIFHYIRMLTGKLGYIYTYTPLRHSMTVAIGATLLALLIGGSLAWLVVRTDMPGRKLINQLAVIPYIMPSWTLAQAWVVLFKNRLSGGTPGFFEFLVGQAPPDWLSYGPVPIIICSALHYYTFFFLFVSAALMSIDSNLEEAGDLMGANRWRILRKITFPLVLPAVLSGVIMTFSKVMGTFGGPNILGTPVNYYVLATMLRGSLGIGDKADAFVLAIVLILFAITTISLNQRLVGTRRSYETIGGRGFVAQLSKLGNMKRYLLVAVIIFQILVIAVPLGLLVYSTVMLKDGNYSLSNFTLQRLSKLVEQLAYIPYVIPGIAFGAVYIAMFARKLGPFPPLYGTFALLVIVSVAKHLPYSSRSGVSAMMQVGRELEEAGQVAGANAWQRFRHIIFPLTTSGFTSGFLLTFITTMRELSLIILLVTPATQLLASQTMFYTENGNDQMANAVILILIAIVAFGNFVIGRFSRGGSLKKGLGM
jgi:iron(III) transport system permease protein